MSERLKNKVVVITGTGDGMARTAALRFAAEGAKIVGCDLRAEKAAETERLVTEQGGQMTSLHPLDLTKEENAERLAAFAVETFGGIDVLYNNAMSGGFGTPLDMPVEEFDFVMAGTIRLPWLVTKSCVPHLKSGGGGVVINIASISGMVGSGMVGNASMLFAYGLAKAAVIRMTQLFAIDFAPDLIRVNSISPGLVATPTNTIMSVGEMGRLHIEAGLVGRIGTADDIVNAALFLASDDSSYMTGQNLVVDGGWTTSGGVGRARPEVLQAFGAIVGGD
jgi:meso-butanediol dehydrogenase / (S,S)-butanediol dehydrogenase / diacetyl reductase